MGPGAKEKKSVPKDQLDQLKKQSDKNQSYMRKVMDKKPTNEGKVEDMSLEQVHSFLEMLKDMGKIKESDIAEVAEKIKGKKEKDPKEAQLREAIRRIIRKQLRK